MALKMIGSHLMPTADYEGAAPQLDLDASKDKLGFQVSTIGQKALLGYQAYAPDIIVLEPMVQMPDVVPSIRNLSDGTIIPRMDPFIPVQSMAGVVLGSLPDSVYSPAPTSIVGLGSLVGTILIMLGKAIVAEIAANVSQDTMRRIGQRVQSQYRIRGKTGQVVSGADEQVRTGVKPVLGRSGFLPNRKHYDGPCEWWEFWCWVV